MKNIILVGIGFLISISQLSAQDIKQDPNTIKVTGESIIQLSPNEIILALDMKNTIRKIISKKRPLM